MKPYFSDVAGKINLLKKSISYLLKMFSFKNKTIVYAEYISIVQLIILSMVKSRENFFTHKR